MRRLAYSLTVQPTRAVLRGDCRLSYRWRKPYRSENADYALLVDGKSAAARWHRMASYGLCRDRRLLYGLALVVDVHASERLLCLARRGRCAVDSGCTARPGAAAAVILPDRAGGGYRGRPRGRSRGRLLVALPIHYGQPNGRKRPLMITAVALAHSGGCPRCPVAAIV